MKILRNVSVPTGNILAVEGEHGQLECLSLGDYGKEVNIKCDALGLSREPSPVRHTKQLPLTEKWVITISSQYGCSMGCKFCDVPRVGPGKNATLTDLIQQVGWAMSLHPEVRGGQRLNLHYARMGEPTFNTDVIASARALKCTLEPAFKFHPVVSTMMPANNPDLYWFLTEWMLFKNHQCEGDAGLQLSINSTDAGERNHMFSHNAKDLGEIADIMASVPRPVGRKITLNFAVAGYTVNTHLLSLMFPPKYFICKLTPMHKTNAAKQHKIATAGDYTEYAPYRALETRLE